MREVLRGVDQGPHRAQGTHDNEQPGPRKQSSHHRVQSRISSDTRPPGQAPAWAPGAWPQQMLWGPPPIQATFDDSSDQVVLFLSQIISHMDLYGRLYLSQWAMVVAITMVLMGEVADWVANLHSNHAKELVNGGLFLETLRGRLEDESRTQLVEGELVALKLGGWPAKDYVKEFCMIALRLRVWPEHLLVHQFHMGLDWDLRQTCVYRGLPPHLADWFRVAIDLDVGLREFCSWGDEGHGQQRCVMDKQLLFWGG